MLVSRITEQRLKTHSLTEQIKANQAFTVGSEGVLFDRLPNKFIGIHKVNIESELQGPKQRHILNPSKRLEPLTIFANRFI